MQCPRCKAEINVVPDPGGTILCPGCGVKLMTRVAAPQGAAPASGSAPASNPPSPAPAPPAAPAASPASTSNPGLEPHHPSATLPPGTPLNKKVARPGEDTAKTARRAAPEIPTMELDTPAAGFPAISRSAPQEDGASVDEVLAAVREVRDLQIQILSFLHSSGHREPFSMSDSLGVDLPVPTALAPVRTRVRKTLLLIDDDQATREAAVAELEQAQVPVRAVADGSAGIEAIAAEKPDVIAIELAIGGNMGGKDVINMIKATMEWVDIPILLYTRLPLESQKEARTVHGADDLVLKRSGAAALVSRVISTFRRAP